VAAVLQDAEASTQQQQQGMQQRQQQQVQPHGLQLGAGRQQDSPAGAALDVLKQRVLSEVRCLGVCRPFRLFLFAKHRTEVLRLADRTCHTPVGPASV
jgi:hypothetical protein